MFILDSLMISGIRWTLRSILTAAEAEMNDDAALRERLMEAELRRDMGEIPDEEFKIIEADLLARIRDIRQRREGAGPLTTGAQAIHASPGSAFQVEAEVTGDFHRPDRPEEAPPTVAKHRATEAGAGRRGRRAKRT
jgi:hypothetical protein